MESGGRWANIPVSGNVLAGGRSSRMGRDKTALPWGSGTLLDHVAGVMREALGNVKIVRAFGSIEPSNTEVPDLFPDKGPLSGLLSALQFAESDWVVVAACDMPNLTPELIRKLAEAALRSSADAVVSCTEDSSGRRLHPLCAAYHRRLKPAVEAAILRNSLKMHDFLSTTRVGVWPVRDPSLLANLNTPQDLASWEAAEHR